jgi:voltage-gated sodium channel
MNAAFFRQIAQNKTFNNFILVTILAAAIVVGVQTYGEKVAAWHGLLEVLDLIILAIFTIELIVKLLAEGNKPQNFFKDNWNIFDFIIVAVCWLAHFIPGMNAGFIAVIRLARVLRVLRLINALPQLRLLVDAMLKSIPSMGYVGILLGVLFYIYAAMGVFLFGGNDPVHFENLQRAMVTLFQIVTLEGWADIMYINVLGCNDPVYGNPDCTKPNPMGIWAVIYFVSFVLIGTMVVLNLFIGVIMNSMDEAREEQARENRLAEKERNGIAKVEDELEGLHDQLEEIKQQINLLSHRLRKGDKLPLN